MSDDALVDALPDTVVREAIWALEEQTNERLPDAEGEDHRIMRAVLAPVLAFLTDPARGDARLVPVTEAEGADDAKSFWDWPSAEQDDQRGDARLVPATERCLCPCPSCDAYWATRLDQARAERDKLAAWKADAMTVMDGLQDLGRALNVPPGKRITAIETAKAARELVAERDALRDAALAVNEALGKDRRQHAFTDDAVRALVAERDAAETALRATEYGAKMLLLVKQRDEARAERDALRKALAWYADRNHYDDEGAPGVWHRFSNHISGEDTEFEPDRGQIARDALRSDEEADRV